MSNPDALANSLEPQTPAVPEEPVDGTFPTDTRGTEWEEERLQAELGDDGRGHAETDADTDADAEEQA